MAAKHVVVVGNGMVGQRFVDRLVALDPDGALAVTVVGAEPRPAYDRVALSSWFRGATEADLALVDPHLLAGDRVRYLLGVEVVAIDVGAGTAALDDGSQLAYDHLVLATGSDPFVPPLDGHDLDGCFTYRTLDDLEQIRARARQPGCRAGLVVGGGLLGLEAADALRALGLEAHVVELAGHPMPQQLTAGGGAMLARWADGLGVTLHCGVRPTRLVGGPGGVEALELEGADPVLADLVVFSAGIRPRDGLARAAGLDVGPRGGVVVDDALSTSAAEISAVGEVACHRGVVYGLVAPGYEMADVLARRLTGEHARYRGSDRSAKLKLLGVDVAGFGASTAAGAAVDEIVYRDPVARTYRRLALDTATGALVGGELVGDTSGFERLAAVVRGEVDQPDDLAAHVLPASVRPPDDGDLPDGALLCTCNAVAVGEVRAAVAGGCSTMSEVRDRTGCGSSCGGCVPAATALVRTELEARGMAVSRALCEHFDHSRQELYDLVRVHRHRRWADVLAAHGRGGGCEVCRPTVGSILASVAGGHVLDGDQAAIQDTNDHHLANMQRDGTYSVVPRVPGGEITPAQLIALGEIARDFDLYTKITGGQRIDLLGAHLADLPAIWQRVLDAGMESGQAYGKAVRTVKSCVGSTWCRYGVQDSVAMAIRLELRYRGIRSPHKIKMAVSGCTRECAEAQSKDVGVIATESGWNLYVCGNGGRSPRHAVLLAADLDDEALVTAIDRFVMFYVRTADRLQRTAAWFEELDGGIDHLRRVVLDDALGIAGELEADLAAHVAGYRCEWRATLEDPERLAHFVEFVNAPDERSAPVRVRARGQGVPA